MKKQNLSQVRIIKRNLVYIIGLPQDIARVETLQSFEYLGQYGKILKIIINKPVIYGPNKNNYCVYVTFQKEKDAMICRLALEEFSNKNYQIKASFGTTKYCQYFINNQTCFNSDCLYLHQLSNENDTYQQDQIQTGIRQIFKQQQEYFIKYLDKFMSEYQNNSQKSTIFTSFQQLKQKYIQQYNQIEKEKKKKTTKKKKINITEEHQPNLQLEQHFQLKVDLLECQNDMDQKIIKEHLLLKYGDFLIQEKQQHPDFHLPLLKTNEFIIKFIMHIFHQKINCILLSSCYFLFLIIFLQILHLFQLTFFQVKCNLIRVQFVY